MYSDSAWWILGGAIAGLIAGSFIATLVIRWPQARGLGGRSACDACGRALDIRDLVPVVSFLFVRGRCRTCGVGIDAKHVAIELTSGLIGAAAVTVAPNLFGIAGALFGWQLLTLAALDVEHYWLPDKLTALLALSGFAVAIAMERDQLVARLIGGAVGFGALFVIAWVYQRMRGRAGMGAGDPKLLGAIGLWLGWQSLPLVLVGASGLGLIAALLMRLRGQSVAADTRLPLGALMAVAAFPLWIWAQR
jgi:leader peptidase (prepilin peptidase) / N-methyltransferase